VTNQATDAEHTGTHGQRVSGPLMRSDKIGEFLIRLYWTPEDARVLWVDFEVAELADVDDETRFGNHPLLAHGFVKSDGGTQFQMPHVHASTAADLRRQFEGVIAARDLAGQCMTGAPNEFNFDKAPGPTT
jgi:hypothetical protein